MPEPQCSHLVSARSFLLQGFGQYQAARVVACPNRQRYHYFLIGKPLIRDCLALRHVAFESAGILESILRRRGCEIRYFEAGVEDLDACVVENVDLLVILGGPIGAYEVYAYPFLIPETTAIGARIACKRPTLGVCLGAQLMAKALGASVAPGPAKEIGWAPVELTAAGRVSPLRHIEGLPVLHWHGDNLAMPPGCENLAATPHCPCQAFRRGENILGLQFHLEADPRAIEAWLIGHTVELANAGLDPRVIRQDTGRYGKQLEEAATKVFVEWLDNLRV
jgi:GMP synthase (glutamine-hydrolysing)